MIHPDTRLDVVDPEVGYGVFATKLIPRGTVIWTLCELDTLYAPEAVAAMPRHYREILYHFSFVRHDGYFVYYCDFGRYVNHSCDPTNVEIGDDVEILARDVGPGEEITCDYGAGNIMRDIDCRCGAAKCRGTIRPEDVLAYGREWDRIATLALPYAARVPQPLRPFVKDPETFDDIVSGRIPMPSVELLYCPSTLRQPALSPMRPDLR